MKQTDLILAYVDEFGSITPAKMARVIYKRTMFGSETSRRCRELRAEGKLKSMGVGRFETFFYELESKEIE